MFNFPIPDDSTWSIRINSGLHTGIYPILSVYPDGSLKLSGWTAGLDTNLNYDLLAPGNVVVKSGTSGRVDIEFVGRLVTSPIISEWDVKQDDFISISGNQYQIITAVDGGANDSFYIDGWSGGTLVGSVTYQALRRIVDNGYGTLGFQGMKLTTTINYESTLGIQNGQNPPSNILDNSDFCENYVILIGTTYYQMSDINGTNIYLSGPILEWGLAGTSPITYTVINFVKVPVVVQDGTSFELLDRRGEGTIEVNQLHDPVPVTFRMQMLNTINNGEALEEAVQTKESIWYTVEMK